MRNGVIKFERSSSLSSYDRCIKLNSLRCKIKSGNLLRMHPRTEIAEFACQVGRKYVLRKQSLFLIYFPPQFFLCKCADYATHACISIFTRATIARAGDTAGVHARDILPPPTPNPPPNRIIHIVTASPASLPFLQPRRPTTTPRRSAPRQQRPLQHLPLPPLPRPTHKY